MTGNVFVESNQSLKMQLRTVLLIVQSIVASLSVAYFLLAMITFGNLRQVINKDNCIRDGAYANGLLAACFLSFAISVLYIVFSIPILLNRCCRKSVEATFAWGILMTATIYSAFFYLLAGLTIQMTNLSVDCLESKNVSSWGSDETNILRATYIFAYICAGAYVVMFIIFTCSRSAFKQQPPMAAQSSGQV
eukprot:TRINITY_DN2797_c0_g4_i2.p1 TRINITY_DN2797_c0_g4~~TRINITY_DN2797_c0_g4_i2.p1  ORF type:complete len:192 (-),score=1.67 TRINITY_DN2797_c0_g4_i2:900-1475(-)